MENASLRDTCPSDSHVSDQHQTENRRERQGRKGEMSPPEREPEVGRG